MTSNGLLNKNSICRNSCQAIKCWKWNVPQLLQYQTRPEVKYAVIILNRTITQNEEFIKNFWNNASVRITVDGGTIHWNTFLSKLSASDQQTMKLPDLITGDFDSITEEVMQKFKKKGCKVLHTPDQNYTDFTKSLMELNKYCKQLNIEMDHVVVIGQASGRIDQILGNIQTLFLVKENHLVCAKTRVYIMSDDSLSWLLYPGDHVISIPEETREHQRAWCSLVPVGEACTSVTTIGLKWNLDNEPLKFGALVSTSNTFDGSEQVKIKCSHTLLWSMKLPSVADPLRIILTEHRLLMPTHRWVNERKKAGGKKTLRHCLVIFYMCCAEAPQTIFSARIASYLQKIRLYYNMIFL